MNGLWISCAGSRSPWNRHLVSEEYEPDARCDTANGDAAYAASSSCTNMEYTVRMDAFRTLYGDATASPYNYGRVQEVGCRLQVTIQQHNIHEIFIFAA